MCKARRALHPDLPHVNSIDLLEQVPPRCSTTGSNHEFWTTTRSSPLTASSYSRSQLEGFYRTFRSRFGPDVLAKLDGEELLETMHAHGNKDSLVYWLEFKNDEEFPAHFGSISGGSAFKFGIFRRKETGTWVTAAAGTT